MSKNNVIKPVAFTVGAAFAGTLAGQAVADTDANPFAMTDLAEGYMVADSHGAEGRCGEGKCGEGMEKPKEAEGQCGAKPKAEEGKCGGKPKGEEEGKCGGSQ